MSLEPKASDSTAPSASICIRPNVSAWTVRVRHVISPTHGRGLLVRHSDGLGSNAKAVVVEALNISDRHMRWQHESCLGISSAVCPFPIAMGLLDLWL